LELETNVRVIVEPPFSVNYRVIHLRSNSPLDMEIALARFPQSSLERGLEERAVRRETRSAEREEYEKVNAMMRNNANCPVNSVTADAEIGGSDDESVDGDAPTPTAGLMLLAALNLGARSLSSESSDSSDEHSMD